MPYNLRINVSANGYEYALYIFENGTNIFINPALRMCQFVSANFCKIISNPLYFPNSLKISHKWKETNLFNPLLSTQKSSLLLCSPVRIQIMHVYSALIERNKWLYSHVIFAEFRHVFYSTKHHFWAQWPHSIDCNTHSIHCICRQLSNRVSIAAFSVFSSDFIAQCPLPLNFSLCLSFFLALWIIWIVCINPKSSKTKYCIIVYSCVMAHYLSCQVAGN